MVRANNGMVFIVFVVDDGWWKELLEIPSYKPNLVVTNYFMKVWALRKTGGLTTMVLKLTIVTFRIFVPYHMLSDGASKGSNFGKNSLTM